MDSELVVKRSVGSVRDTVDRLRAALDESGIHLFAVIDHSDAARVAGLELDDEVVAIFGNPAAGTPLMRADRRAGLDLPLRMLIWSDAGTTTLAYRSPLHLASTYDLDTVRPAVEKLDAVMRGLAEVASGS